MRELRRVDPVEWAHLKDETGWSPPVERFAPAPALADLVRRYWLPVWSLAPGKVTVQRVLRYPVCLIVVADSYARFYGPETGLSRQQLSGSGWACGVMLQPAAGALALGGPVSRMTDQACDLSELATLDGARLTRQVRAALAERPSDPGRQRAALGEMEAVLADLPAVDEEGHLVNAVVDLVETDHSVQRVWQVCAKVDLSERALQRLCARRIGLSPKWLVQRRRLQDAAGLLAADDRVDLARLADELGYADQAHLTRDFRAVTGLTPARYAAQRRP